MSFIFGIVDFVNTPADLSADIEKLATATSFENFNVSRQTFSFYALGDSTHPKFPKKSRIISSADITIVADITIYNSTYLKSFFNYNSDEEAFLKAYQKWGVDCANHINGEFAVVAVDQQLKKVFLFKDHIGSRPLSYTFSGNRLIFSSSAFAIAKSKLTAITYSKKYLVQRYFFKQKSDYSLTHFNTIFKLKPATVTSFGYKRKEEIKYWHPEKIKQAKNLSFDESVKHLSKLFKEACSVRLSEGNIGVHVSGGLDSTGIASMLCDLVDNKSRVKAYSWSPVNAQENTFKGEDERKYIELFALEKKIAVNYLNTSEDETAITATIPEFERMTVEHSIMQKGLEDNVDSIFSGWGGDELISMGTRGVVNHLFYSLKWFSLYKVAVKKGWRWLLVKLNKEVLLHYNLLSIYKRKKDAEKIKKYFNSEIFSGTPLHFFKYKTPNFFGYGNRTQYMINLLENQHIAARIDSWSYFSEKYGFTYKFPLLDKALIEFFVSIPVHFTFKEMQTRILFREILKGICPEEIRLRKNKNEDFRISNAKLQKKIEFKHLKGSVLALKENEHLPYFNKEEIIKICNNPSILSDEELQQKKYILEIYIKEVRLYLNYFS